MNILLTSAGRRTYLIEYFKEALNNRGSVYASNSIDTYSLHKADGYVLTPTIYNENYIDFLIDYCQQHEITAIISLFDIDLPILALHKRRFEQNGIMVVVSDFDTTQLCNDKWRTYQFLMQLGLPQTRSFINIDEVRHCIECQELSFPLILKPRWGMGSIGIYQANNISELEVLYSKLYNEIFNTYLKYESSLDKSACIIIQEVIDGQEYGIEILNDLKGNYVATFAKKKIAMRSGETDIAETVDPTMFEGLARLISENIRHLANMDVDCFLTKDNQIVVLEMNCRFGGQYPFTHMAGVDVPKQIIKWLEGGYTDMTLLQQSNGVRGCKDLTPVKF